MKSPQPLVDIIAGARPNFMKIAPIIHAIQARQAQGSRLRFRLVHTGQHYDERMSGDFFTQLGIPLPDINLEVGSGTQAEQTAAILVRYEKLLLDARSNLCLVVGDVTSTMACAITAQKLGVPVAHVEAGIRSGDWAMPEEINRMVTDSITNWFFTTSEVANNNLRRSGVPDERIFFVGNTMIDSVGAIWSTPWKNCCCPARGLRSGSKAVTRYSTAIMAAAVMVGRGSPTVRPSRIRSRKKTARMAPIQNSVSTRMGTMPAMTS